MSVFSFPCRLLICDITRESSIVGGCASRGVRRHQKECGSASVRGCDFAIRTTFLRPSGTAELLFCLAFCKHYSLINSAGTLDTKSEMRTAALLICLASGPLPRPNAAHSQLACNCLISRREPSHMPKSCARDANSIAVPRADTHSPYAHIRRDRHAAPLVRGARQPHRNERGHRRGQRSLVSARRRGQRPLERFTVPRAGANGHGYMTKPKSRQAEAFEANGWPNQVAECATASFVHSIATAPPPYSTGPPPCAIDVVP